MLPEEAKECIVYALKLVERSFQHRIFLHSATVKRMFAVQFGLAFKMVAEIDVLSVNVNLASILNVSLAQFNEMESEVCAALDFNIGVSADDFSAHFATIDSKCT